MNLIVQIQKVRTVKLILLCIIIAAASFFTSCSATKEEEKRYNFLVIMADDVSADKYGCYGDKSASTPNLDRLADEGVMFNTAWAAPICSPARAMIMTGCYANQTGWYHNALRVPDENGGTDFQENFKTFPVLLHEAGYATAIGGKWQLPGSITSKNGGFDEYCIWEPSAGALPQGAEFNGQMENEDTQSRYWHPAIIKNGRLVKTKPGDFGPDICTDFLVEFIENNKDKPFLAYYPMILPHGTRTGRTTTPASGNQGDLTNGTFREGVDYTDVLTGRLVEALEQNGLLENTIIIFTADNPIPAKNIASDEGARVPMIIYNPEIISKSHVSDELVSLADVLPTLCDLAGVDLPGNYKVDGKSLVPYLRGETDTHRDWLYSYVGTARMIRDKNWVWEAIDSVYNNPEGRFYDCRNGECIEVTGNMPAEAKKARERFIKVLSNYPPPNTGDPEVQEILERYDGYRFRHRLE